MHSPQRRRFGNNPWFLVAILAAVSSPGCEVGELEDEVSDEELMQSYSTAMEQESDPLAGLTECEKKAWLEYVDCQAEFLACIDYPNVERPSLWKWKECKPLFKQSCLDEYGAAIDACPTDEGGAGQ